MSWFLAALIVPVGVALTAFGYHRWSSWRESRLHPPTGELVSIGEAKLHVQIAGWGKPTVVLDSALAGSSLSWSKIQPRLAEVTRIVSYDRAGFGWSEPIASSRTVDHMVGELRRLLLAAAVEPPYVLVGHSYGGWIAQLFASRYRDDTAGLVLVDCPHPREWMEPDPIQRSRVHRGARLARRAALVAHFGLIRWMFLLGNLPLFGEHDRVSTLIGKTPPEIRSQLKTFWVRPHTLEALASQIENAPESAATVFAETSDLGDLPLVVLSAANPDPRRLQDQRQTAALSRRGRHVIATKSGHWIPLEEPELVVSAVREVVEAIR